MPLAIRPATVADRAAVLELAPRLREGVASWRPEPGVARAVRSWVEGSLASMDEAGHAALVAELDGRIVGLITLSPVRHWAGELDGSIGALAVDHDAESRGVGAALVEAIIARAREEGVHAHVRQYGRGECLRAGSLCPPRLRGRGHQSEPSARVSNPNSQANCGMMSRP